MRGCGTKKIISGICILFLIAGCNHIQPSDKRIETEIRCSNIDFWNNRGDYPDFKCNLEYLQNNRALRECSATLVEVDDEFNVKRAYLNTTCLTTCYKNCAYNGRKIY